MQDPLELFSAWLDEAKPHFKNPNAMSLATVGPDLQPSCRQVLLKSFDQNGFVFFTNYESQKSTELAFNPKASLCFYWDPLDRQIRIEGHAIKVSREESVAYFSTRDRGSQIGAWASQQSKILGSREQLEQAVENQKIRFSNQEIPCPPHWGGWRLEALKIEFWQGRANRLHERTLYWREHSQQQNWQSCLLCP